MRSVVCSRPILGGRIRDRTALKRARRAHALTAVSPMPIVHAEWVRPPEGEAKRHEERTRGVLRRCGVDKLHDDRGSTRTGTTTTCEADAVPAPKHRPRLCAAHRGGEW